MVGFLDDDDWSLLREKKIEEEKKKIEKNKKEEKKDFKSKKIEKQNENFI